MTSYQDILHFWFNELSVKDWWSKNDLLDQNITRRFGDLHHQASQGELWSWRESCQGRLAEIIVLDQFSRNIYRNHRKSFANDPMALALSQEAVAKSCDQNLSADEKSFLYIPFMHSESSAIHHQAVKLYDQPGLEKNLEFEILHKNIIDRFGRYPHRNKILGRESTKEEIDFLKTPGSSF